MFPFKSEQIPSEFMNISSEKVTAQWKRNYCNSGKHWSHERGSLAARRCSFQIWLPTMKQKREQLGPNDTIMGLSYCKQLHHKSFDKTLFLSSHNCQKICKNIPSHFSHEFFHPGNTRFTYITKVTGLNGFVWHLKQIITQTGDHTGSYGEFLSHALLPLCMSRKSLLSLKLL